MVGREFRPSLTVILIVTLLTAIGYDGIRLVHERRFNDALAAANKVFVDGPDGAHLKFAKASELQKQGDFKAAVKAYAAIEAPPRSRLQLDIQFNLANLFFREAIRLRDDDADDLAMPLLELAKQNYKEVLRVDSGQWDAKYNLELALILSPELEPADALEELNPEHSTRALTIIQSREPLP